MDTSFVPGWAVGIPLVILAATWLWYAMTRPSLDEVIEEALEYEPVEVMLIEPDETLLRLLGEEWHR